MKKEITICNAMRRDGEKYKVKAKTWVFEDGDEKKVATMFKNIKRADMSDLADALGVPNSKMINSLYSRTKRGYTLPAWFIDAYERCREEGEKKRSEGLVSSRKKNPSEYKNNNDEFTGRDTIDPRERSIVAMVKVAGVCKTRDVADRYYVLPVDVEKVVRKHIPCEHVSIDNGIITYRSARLRELHRDRGARRAEAEWSWMSG